MKVNTAVGLLFHPLSFEGVRCQSIAW